MVKKEWIDKGFVDEPIAKELDLKSDQGTLPEEECRHHGALLYGRNHPGFG